MVNRKEQSPRANIRKQEIIAIPRQVETCPFLFRRVLLRSNGIQAESDVNWKPYSQEQGQGYGDKNMILGTRRVNRAGIYAMSRRLKSLERARALGRKPADPRSYLLELEAKRWAEERARRELSATRGV